MILKLENAAALRPFNKEKRKSILKANFSRLGFEWLFLVVIASFSMAIFMLGLLKESAWFGSWVFYVAFIVTYYVGYLAVINWVSAPRLTAILSEG